MAVYGTTRLEPRALRQVQAASGNAPDVPNSTTILNTEYSEGFGTGGYPAEMVITNVGVGASDAAGEIDIEICPDATWPAGAAVVPVQYGTVLYESVPVGGAVHVRLPQMPVGMQARVHNRASGASVTVGVRVIPQEG